MPITSTTGRGARDNSTTGRDGRDGRATGARAAGARDSSTTGRGGRGARDNSTSGRGARGSSTSGRAASAKMKIEHDHRTAVKNKYDKFIHLLVAIQQICLIGIADQADQMTDCLLVIFMNESLDLFKKFMNNYHQISPETSETLLKDCKSFMKDFTEMDWEDKKIHVKQNRDFVTGLIDSGNQFTVMFTDMNETLSQFMKNMITFEPSPEEKKSYEKTAKNWEEKHKESKTHSCYRAHNCKKIQPPEGVTACEHYHNITAMIMCQLAIIIRIVKFDYKENNFLAYTLDAIDAIEKHKTVSQTSTSDLSFARVRSRHYESDDGSRGFESDCTDDDEAGA